MLAEPACYWPALAPAAGPVFVLLLEACITTFINMGIAAASQEMGQFFKRVSNLPYTVL